jgi:hypothetical protein
MLPCPEELSLSRCLQREKGPLCRAAVYDRLWRTVLLIAHQVIKVSLHGADVDSRKMARERGSTQRRLYFNGALSRSN